MSRPTYTLEDSRAYVVVKDGTGEVVEMILGLSLAKELAEKQASGNGGRYLVYELVAAVKVKAEWEYFGDEPE